MVVRCFSEAALGCAFPQSVRQKSGRTDERGRQVLEVEIVKQAGMETYTRTFELPVGKAYKMYDSIMRGICEADK